MGANGGERATRMGYSRMGYSLLFVAVGQKAPQERRADGMDVSVVLAHELPVSSHRQPHERQLHRAYIGS